MRLLPPLLLHYYITERCNCHCTFCDIWKIPAKKSNDAKCKDVLKNLKDARRLGVRFVDFTGGEPLLHNDLPVMLKDAKRLGFQTSITTNCLRYERRAEDLKGLINFLHFSLDGLSAKKHNAIRGQDSFLLVMQSIDSARTLGERPDLLFTVNSDNITHLEPLTEFAQRLGLMLIVNPVFAYAEFEQSDAHVLKQIERFASTPFVYVNKAFHLLRRRGGNAIKSPRCRVVDSTIVISPDNKVVLPCYHFQQEKLPLSEKVIAYGLSAARNDFLLQRNSSTWQHFYKNQGRFDFCQGCHLNCYFDPSFHYKLDDYFWQSGAAKSRYWWDKNVRRKMWDRKFDTRPAAVIAADIMENYDKD